MDFEEGRVGDFVHGCFVGGQLCHDLSFVNVRQLCLEIS